MFPVQFSCIYSEGSSIITFEVVAAQEALERHRNPPRTLIDSFNLAWHIVREAQDLEKFGAPLTSIANRAFVTCRLLVLRVPPDGALFPSHPTERDYHNGSVLTSGLVVLSTHEPHICYPAASLIPHFPQRILQQTSELLKGPLEDTSAMEKLLEIILACITQLKQSFEEARAVNVAPRVEDINSILSVVKTALHDFNTVEGDGVDIDLGPHYHDAGSPGLRIFGLASETHEDEVAMQNLELSSLSETSDQARIRSGIFGDGGLSSESPYDACQYHPGYLIFLMYTSRCTCSWGYMQREYPATSTVSTRHTFPGPIEWAVLKECPREPSKSKHALQYSMVNDVLPNTLAHLQVVLNGQIPPVVSGTCCIWDVVGEV
jgi:hypothetical protein